MSKGNVHLQVLGKNIMGNSLLTNSYQNSAVKSTVIREDCQDDVYTTDSSTEF